MNCICGEEPRVVRSYSPSVDLVICKECDRRGPARSKRADAIAAWNEQTQAVLAMRAMVEHQIIVQPWFDGAWIGWSSGRDINLDAATPAAAVMAVAEKLKGGG
ncbi:MAG: hypothetical protein ACOY3P_24220 [Planctomycetota bacterium]